MIPSLIARDAPTSIRRACPLCPEDKPDLGPNENPIVGPITYTDPEPVFWGNGWAVEYSMPEVLSWRVSCGHEVSAKEWAWICSALQGSCADFIYFWWVPRMAYDIAWIEKKAAE